MKITESIGNHEVVVTPSNVSLPCDTDGGAITLTWAEWRDMASFVEHAMSVSAMPRPLPKRP